ncbi:uncharacterized protein LOC107645363 isoform X1 [Arachis ipaensis]|uniref:uncharacterized protein LOC107645363 isoform X1 n=1 Tax=Arachis ipaensis TaxID=130454 RepID=UPI000A2B251D|nr:uncharacterized protein LOC107645363 isoform X1 [Arachis ipaensis]XP_025658273.1 uncharacterized protein LOC112754738 isoform X1 [Arachis hypogaea]
MLQRLCLMASHGYLPGLVLHPEFSFSSTNTKVCQTSLPALGAAPDIITYRYPCLKSHPNEESRKSRSELLDYNQLINVEFSAQRPIFIDIQPSCPNPVLLSSGIVEQCTKRDKILQVLQSRTAEQGIDGENLSLLLDLTKLQLPGIDKAQRLSSPFWPNSEFYIPKPLLEFVQDSAITSKITVHPDGQVTFMGSAIEMKDFLAAVAESYILENSHKGEKKSMLVPYFSRGQFSLKIESALTAPLKSSPEKVKMKPSQKKKKKLSTERDLYKRNGMHACESLLSLMVDKKQRRQTAMLSLKKSGPELSELLTQFSAGIAGTGLAVLLSVMCELACGRIPISASKMFNTVFGFALVWLSWAVNKLRATVVSISKNAGKSGSKEEDMFQKLDKSIQGIYWSAAALLAVAVLRLA